MTDRIGTANRDTAEVNIDIEIRLDEPGCEISLSAREREPDIEIAMGKHFFDQIHRFSGFGAKIVGEGDYPHHVLEDVGICWGQAFKQALGNRAGIRRTESHIMPMEGIVVTVSVDISGRPYAAIVFQNDINSPMAEQMKHVLTSMAAHGAFDLYVKVEVVSDLSIRLIHHALETVAKALGRVLGEAARVEGTEVLSTKEALA